jgi:8-oxo-dGTP pyrophosphatase MutT (NUDIX family)
MNSEAQWNIREAVRALIQTGQVNLVALEGSTDDLRLQPFASYPRREAIEGAADHLLKENKISGPVHAALTSTGKLPLVLGIDDPVHYEANVKAYVDSRPFAEKSRREQNLLQNEIENRKKEVFSSSLLGFDRQVQAYRFGTISLGAYVQTLLSQSPHESQTPMLNSFNAALEMEKAMDFVLVESERRRLIERLAQRLSAEEVQNLLLQSVAYRSGQCRYADFYAQLKETCGRKGIPLSDFPAMDAYVRYVLLADGIEAERLLEDIGKLEKRIYDRLAVTSEAKELVLRSRKTWLAGKLTDFSLTPAEWKEYNEESSSHRRSDLASFESFYREAQSRDLAMAENLMTALNRPAVGPKAVAVLVTGGYHAQGLAEQLTRRGVTVVSYVPKIEKVNTVEGSAYLSVFTQQKAPLEKIFSGEKLYLAQNPFREPVRLRLGFWARARELWLGKGRLSGQVQAELERLRANPTLATDNLVYRKGKLFLRLDGKEVAILGERGEFFFDFEKTLSVPPAIPLPARWRAIVLEFPRFLATRWGRGMTWFVFRDHARGNTDLRILSLRLMGMERIAQATDIGFGVGLLLSLTFSWWFLPVTLFGSYALAHYLHLTLVPEAPAMSDVFSPGLPAVPRIRTGWATALPGSDSDVSFESPQKPSVGPKQLREFNHLLLKTMKQRDDRRKDSTLQARYETSRNALFKQALSISPPLAEMYNGKEVDSVESGADWDVFLGRIFRFIYLPYGWCAQEVGKNKLVPLINPDRWRRVDYFGYPVWVGEGTSDASVLNKTVFPSLISATGIVLVDPAGIHAYTRMIWTLLMEKGKTGLLLSWQSLFMRAVDSLGVFSDAYVEELIRELVVREKHRIYAAMVLRKPLEEVTSRDILKVLALPHWSWRDECSLLAEELNPHFRDETEKEDFLAKAAWDAAAGLESLIELLRFLGHGGALPADEKNKWFAQAIATSVLFGSMQIAKMSQGQDPEDVLPQKYLLDLIGRHVHIKTVQEDGTLREDGLVELTNELLSGDLSDYSTFLRVLEEIRASIVFSPEERFFRVFGKAPTPKEVDVLTSNFPLATPSKTQPKGDQEKRKGELGPRRISVAVRSLLIRWTDALKSIGSSPASPEASAFNERGLRLAADLEALFTGADPGGDFAKATSRFLELRKQLQDKKIKGNKDSVDLMSLVEEVRREAAAAIFRNRLEELQQQMNPAQVVAAIRGFLELGSQEVLLDALPAEAEFDLDDSLAGARRLLVNQKPFPIKFVLENKDLFGLEPVEVEVLERFAHSGTIFGPAPLASRAVIQNLQEKLGRSFPLALKGDPIQTVEPSSVDICISPHVTKLQWDALGLRSVGSIQRFVDGIQNGCLPGSWTEFKRHFPGIYRGRMGDSRIYVRFVPKRPGSEEWVVSVLALGPKSNFTTERSGALDKPTRLLLGRFVEADSLDDGAYAGFEPLVQAPDGTYGLPKKAAPASLAYWVARWRGVEEAAARRLGMASLAVEIPLLLGSKWLAENPRNIDGSLFALMGYDPLWGVVFAVGLAVFAGVHFYFMKQVAVRRHELPPTPGQRLRLLGVFFLYFIPGGVGSVLGPVVHGIMDFYQLVVDRTPPAQKPFSGPEVTGKGYEIELLDKLPLGVNGEVSVRVIVKWKGKYLLLENQSGGWEGPGGSAEGDETRVAALRRELVQELGPDWNANGNVSFLTEGEERPLFVHRIRKPNGEIQYRSVQVAIIDLGSVKRPRIKLNFESKGVRWVTYDQALKEVGGCTLATRLALLTEFLRREYGIVHVTSMIPIAGDGRALLIKTREEGAYVLRKAGADMGQALFYVGVQNHLHSHHIPVREILPLLRPHSDQKGFILTLDGQPMVLERFSEKGEPVKKEEAQEEHFYALGSLAAKIQTALKDFKKGQGFGSSPLVDGLENPSIVAGLQFWNVRFGRTEKGDRAVVDLCPLDHPRLKNRYEELTNIGFGTNQKEMWEALLKGFDQHSLIPLNPTELRSIWDAFSIETTKRTLVTGRLMSPRLFPVSNGARLGITIANKAFNRGEGVLDFNRLKNHLLKDGQVLPWNEVNGTISDLWEDSKQMARDAGITSNPESIGLPTGNVGMNTGYLAFQEGNVYRNRRETDWEGPRLWLVTDQEGRTGFARLKFQEEASGKWVPSDEQENLQRSIISAFRGPMLVRDGHVQVDPLEWDDLRHVFRLPVFLDLPGFSGRMLTWGFADGVGELAQDARLRQAAFRGEPVSLSLASLDDQKISSAKRETVFAAWGYSKKTERAHVRIPGDYFVDPATNKATIRFLPGVHPHTVVGQKTDGTIAVVFVPGETNDQGASLENLADQLVRQGFVHAMVVANGKDTVLFQGETEQRVEEAREQASVLLSFKPRSPEGIDPSQADSVLARLPALTEPDRGIVRDILKNLGDRPIPLGVDGGRGWVSQTAQRYARGPSGRTVDPSAPPVLLGNAPTLLVSDADSLTKEGLENLRGWMTKDRNVFLVTDRELSGVALDRRLLIPSAFGEREEKNQLALPVSLAAVRRSGALRRWGLQQSFHLVQTPSLLLDVSDLTQTDPLRQAADNPLVILLETMRAFPAGPTNWKGVLKLLQAIAEAA